MDYKKIFNESNLEKQEESKMRLNECGSYGGCGYSWTPSTAYKDYDPSTIFGWLDAEPEFANVDRKYMKGWCQRNTYGNGKRGKNYYITKFRRALKDKEERDARAAERKANNQTLIDNFDLTEGQIKAAKAAKRMNSVIVEKKYELDRVKSQYEKLLAQQKELWDKAGGTELWDEILANGYKLN